jgi:hypothetical protein
MSSMSVTFRRAHTNRAAMVALIGVLQIAWLAALAYGVVWLLT